MMYVLKPLNGIKNMHVNSQACIRVKGGESKRFRIDSGVRHGCIVFLWLFNVYMDAVMKEVKMEMGRRREWILPGLLYANDLDFCGESEEDLWALVGPFVEVCRRRDLKINAGNIKVMGLNGEKEVEHEVCADGIRLEHVLEFKYLRYFGRIGYR